MSLTPPHQLPTIRESSTLGLRFGVGTWCVIAAVLVSGVCTLIGAVRWCDAIHAKQEAQGAVQVRQTETLERIEATVREIEFRQKYGITAGLPGTVKANP